MIRIACLAVLVATPVWATADGPDAWAVTGVASDDVLNLRMGPGTEYLIIGALAYDARGVQDRICVPTLTATDYFALSDADRDKVGAQSRWCFIEAPDGTTGWANMRYMEEDSGE